MRVAEYIAEFVYEKGVKNIFMLSGNGSIYLDDAFAFHPGMKYITARHEATAAVMAEASAKLTNHVGVVVTTTGPGGANAFSGVVEAWVDSVPLLVISGQVKRHQMASNLRSFGVQGFNITESVKNITKYAAVVTDPAQIRYHLEKAFYFAKEGRPGPVWLDIPWDVQASNIEKEALSGFVQPSSAVVPHGWQADADDALSIISQSERPLIIVGQGVRSANAIADFRLLIEQIGAPVVSSRLGQDILPDLHPLYFNLAGIRGHRHTGLILRECDVVLSLGSSMSHAFIGESGEAFARETKIIMVDLDRAEVEKPCLNVYLPILHDVREVMQYMTDRMRTLQMHDYKEWVETCRNFKNCYPMIHEKDRTDPINSYCFLECLEKASDAHHIFVSDAGSSYYIAGQILRFDKGQREITSGAFASMGMTLPLSIGAAVTDRDSQVLAITGDGSIELNIQELSTIAQYALDIKIFVINNGGYASIRNTQDNVCDGRYTDQQPILNFEKIADAFQLPFFRLDQYETLDYLIPQILHQKGPALIEVICDSHQQMIFPLISEE